MTNARGAAQPPDQVVAAPAAAEPIHAPDRLSAAEIEIWREWAPLAIAAGTLATTTVGAFAIVCALEADYRELRGRLTHRDRPLLVASENEMAIRREVRALALAVRAGLKDFAISPFGKQVLGDQPDEHDPLDDFMRR